MSKNQKNTTQKLGSTEAEKKQTPPSLPLSGEEKVKKEVEVIEKQKQEELEKKKEEKKKEEQKKGETEKKATGKTKIKLVCDVLYWKWKRKKWEILELESEELSKFSKSFYELV